MSNTASDHPQGQKKKSLGPWEFYIACPTKVSLGACQKRREGNTATQLIMSFFVVAGTFLVCLIGDVLNIAQGFILYFVLFLIQVC